MIQLLILLGTAGVVAGGVTTVEVSFSQAILVVGCPVEVTCNVLQTEAKTITYKWFVAGVEKTEHTERSFKIPELKSGDDGQTYKCEAYEGTVKTEGETSMTVVANGDASAKPRITPTDTSTIGAGDQLTLTCNTDAQCEGMTYKWWKGTSNADIEEAGQQKKTWEFTASVREDTTKYKCQSLIKTVPSADSVVKEVTTKFVKGVSMDGADTPVIAATDPAIYTCNVDVGASVSDTITYAWTKGGSDASNSVKTYSYDTSTASSTSAVPIACTATVGNAAQDEVAKSTTAAATPAKPEVTVKEGVNWLTKNVKYTLKCDSDASKSYTSLTYEWTKGVTNGEDTVIAECTKQECEITAEKNKFNCKVTVAPSKESNFATTAKQLEMKEEKGKYCEAIADCNTDPTVYSGDCIAKICACKNNGEKLNNGCLAGNPGTRATYSLVVLVLAAFTGYLMKM